MFFRRKPPAKEIIPELIFVSESDHYVVFKLVGFDGELLKDVFEKLPPLIEPLYTKGYRLCASELVGGGRLIFEKP